MNLLQKFMTGFVSSETAERWESETRQYRAQCKLCSHEFDAWDVGGIIYKATADRHSLVKCPACHRRSMTHFAKTAAGGR